MPEIKVIDGVTVNPSVQLRDDAPLAKAGLTQFLPATKEFAQSLTRPIDEVEAKALATEAKFGSPDKLSDSTTSLTFGAGVNCQLSIFNHSDGMVFDDDNFSPKIEIGEDEVWVAVEVDSMAQAKFKAKANGLGIAVGGQTAVDLTTYSRIAKGQDGFPMLKDAIGTACNNFGILLDAASIRDQPLGTVRVTDTSGSVTIAASAELPVELDAFASVDLPLNAPASVAPSVTLAVAAALKLEGALVVRCYRIDADTCQLGVYRKRGETLKLSLDAGGGVSGTVGDKDLLSLLLNKAFAVRDNASIPNAKYKQLNKVLSDAVDRSLSIAMNASFSSSDTHEAAFLVSVRLSAGDANATDEAINAALHGDWTLLSGLKNATVLRDLTVQTTSKKGLIQINLLGFYTAVTSSSYLQSCTILVDEHGDLTITDEVTASKLSVVGMPYQADRDKLRKALMDSFLATAAYKLVGSKLSFEIDLTQCYFDYANAMDRNRMRANLLLAYALGVAPKDSLNDTLADPRWLDHVSYTATVKYKNADLMRMFFKDPVLQTPWNAQELTALARNTMLTLIYPETIVEQARIAALQNSAYWNELGNRPAGNYAASSVLPDLIKQQAIRVHTDWMEITSWANAIVNVGTALAQTLQAVQASTTKDPRKDKQFEQTRKNLANKLGGVAKSSTGSLTKGWGEFVQFALSGRNGTATVDIEVESATRHLERVSVA